MVKKLKIYSSVIDITEILFALLIKVSSHSMQKYWKPWK